MRQDRATAAMPSLHVIEVRLELIALRGILVRKGEMIAVTNVVVVALCPRFSDAEHRAVRLEQRACAEILGVSKTHFEVRRMPRNTSTFAPPRNRPPEINALLNAAFFAFMS